MDSKIISCGIEEFKKSKIYLEKVKIIQTEIWNQYEPLLENENNFIRRNFLRIKMNIDIRREISKITSLENLHHNT